MKKAVFIFRRDLRLEDNTGLIAALKENDKVIPCFIFDPRQVKNNPYKSENSIQFMIESLEDLEKQLKPAKLYTFYGKTEQVIKKIVKKEKIETIYVNRDYTPFSKKRDKAINKICTLKQYDDYLLNAPEEVLKDDGKPYTIFTPYYKKATKKQVKKPAKNKHNNYYTKPIKTYNYKKLVKKNPDIYVHGGRTNCLKLLKNLPQNYSNTHNYPAKDTTLLSAHNKFGTCSIREVYHTIKEKQGWHSPILRQLYWRDFFTQIVHHYPHVIGHSFRKKYEKIKWSYDKKKFKAWCQGKTGFPIVDAGMRQLNKTGFMHNRVRMIVAQFLTKDLHIDWKLGEKYFATKLVDYDPSVNNGNWQWSASTGCDAQPYFRIFNPWRQQIKFDYRCEYIKKYVAELKDTPFYIIHKASKQKIQGYPSPIVEHEIESKKAKKMFSAVQ
ncbi:DNA photolyase family protein [Candidatus Woesearchaeota archaeon]|nr:DNA photolyase family protein [Candidatus Woesearchaeota archaeon]